MFRSKNLHIIMVPLVIISSACVSFQVPKDYVPDSKVVFLKQKVEFGPVHYDPVAADPYTFDSDNTAVNGEKPAFLTGVRWENLLKPDFKADSRLYREFEAHARYVLGLDAIAKLRAKLDAAVINITPPLPQKTGDLVKQYTNGATYQYPDVAGAQITVFENGDYQIAFADKSKFAYWTDGSYQRTDASGGMVFQYIPKTSYIVSTIDGDRYTASPGLRGIETATVGLEFHETPHDQYRFTLSKEKGAPDYTIFVDKDKKATALAIVLGNGLRFDYFTDNQGITVSTGNQVITIDQNFQKTHRNFDEVKREPTSLLSIFLPQGLRLTNFDGTGLSYADVNAIWPEQYKQKTIGPFSFLYNAKDETAVSALNAQKLTEIESKVRALSGLGAVQKRTIVIPPTLDAYRKLHASEKGEKLLWYPSGFETQDIIVMWPFSVPRYDKPEGQKYFFEQEFYEILSHEYVHILVGENSGLFSPVPVWLNEGLAVYVESQLSPETGLYWDTTFAVAQGLGHLLDWDLVTTKSTGELEIAKARVHYAQSYAMVKALVEKFGIAKVAEYVKSFRVKSTEYDKVNLKSTFRDNFRTVFGIDWKQASDLLKPKEKAGT